MDIFGDRDYEDSNYAFASFSDTGFGRRVKKVKLKENKVKWSELERNFEEAKEKER